MGATAPLHSDGFKPVAMEWCWYNTKDTFRNARQLVNVGEGMVRACVNTSQNTHTHVIPSLTTAGGLSVGNLLILALSFGKD